MEFALQVFLVINVFILGIVVTVAILHARENKHAKNPSKQSNNDSTVLPAGLRERMLENAIGDYQQIIDDSRKDLKANLDATINELNQQIEKTSRQIVDEGMQQYRGTMKQIGSEASEDIDEATKDVVEYQEKLKRKLAEKQAEFDEKLSLYRTALDAKLAEHRAKLEAELTERQNEYARAKTESLARITREQSELEASIKEREAAFAKRQAELDSKLAEQQKIYLEKQAAAEAKMVEDMKLKRDELSRQIDARLSEAVASFLTDALQYNIDLGSQGDYLVQVLEQHKDELKRGLDG